MKLAPILLASLMGLQAYAGEPSQEEQQDNNGLTSIVKVQTGTDAAGNALFTEVIGDSFKRTLYSFDPDSGAPGSSACNGKCAEVWPPVTVTADEVKALNDPEFGTVKRTSGLLQLTYNGKPMYTFNMDRNPGDIKGDGLGGVWHILLEE
jgi:predicted lipoprotein with Yx(FWY)xxD motif